MNTNTDTGRGAVAGQVERPVGRLEPERDSGGMTYRWLVEKFTPEGQSTGLYMACQVNMTLTADVNAARKFRRQRTAEFRALDMREARRGDWRAVEHGFDDSKPPNRSLNLTRHSGPWLGVGRCVLGCLVSHRAVSVRLARALGPRRGVSRPECLVLGHLAVEHALCTAFLLG